jgi:hypothetical protein
MEHTTINLRIINIENDFTKNIIEMYNMYNRLNGTPEIMYNTKQKHDSDIVYSSDGYDISDISDTDSGYYSQSSDNTDDSNGTIITRNRSLDFASDSSDDEAYFRRNRRKDRHRLSMEEIYDNYSQNSPINYPSGYTTEINKFSPIISYLINRRISNCRVGPSSHIAAFLPSNIDIGSCFISGYRKKGRHR